MMKSRLVISDKLGFTLGVFSSLTNKKLKPVKRPLYLAILVLLPHFSAPHSKLEREGCFYFFFVHSFHYSIIPTSTTILKLFKDYQCPSHFQVHWSVFSCQQLLWFIHWCWQPLPVETSFSFCTVLSPKVLSIYFIPLFLILPLMCQVAGHSLILFYCYISNSVFGQTWCPLFKTIILQYPICCTDMKLVDKKLTYMYICIHIFVCIKLKI